MVFGRLGFIVVLALLLPSCEERTVGPGVPVELEELRAALVQSDGHAVIGFKESKDLRGVDPVGRVLTSPETRAEMERYLMSRGAKILRAFDLPAVVVQLPLEDRILADLLNHSNIDYVEPIVGGSRL